MTAVEVTCLSYSHVIHSYFHSFIRSWNRFSKPCTARPELALTEYSFITSNHLDFCVTQRFCTYLKSCQRIVRMTVYRSRKTNASTNPFRQHGVNIGTPYNFVGLKSDIYNFVMAYCQNSLKPELFLTCVVLKCTLAQAFHSYKSSRHNTRYSHWHSLMHSLMNC